MIEIIIHRWTIRVNDDINIGNLANDIAVFINNKWEVVSQIHIGTLEGSVVMTTFKRSEKDKKSVEGK